MSNKKTPKYEIDKQKLPVLIVLLLGLCILLGVIFTLDARLEERDATIAELTIVNNDLNAQLTAMTAELSAAKDEAATAVTTAFDVNMVLATKEEELNDVKARIEAAEQALNSILAAITPNMDPGAELNEGADAEVVVEEVKTLEETEAVEETELVAE